MDFTYQYFKNYFRNFVLVCMHVFIMCMEQKEVFFIISFNHIFSNKENGKLYINFKQRDFFLDHISNKFLCYPIICGSNICKIWNIFFLFIK